MGALLLLGQADGGERSHAGVDAVHRLPVQRLPGLLAVLLHRREQVRRDGDGLSARDGPDQAEVRVAYLGDHQCGHL